jgi:hypothetical protein
MRRVNVVLLVLAGALAGAVLMRVTQHRARVAIIPPQVAPAIAANQPVAPSQAATPEPVQAADSPASEAVTTPVNNDTKDHVAAAPKRPAPHKAVRRRAPLTTVATVATVAAAPRAPNTPLHTPAQRVEIQEPLKVEQVPLSSVSPPVTPEQPKETPPARMDLENATPSAAPLPVALEPNQATLNAGMLIPVRLLDNLSSERNHAGDVFGATLEKELVANGFVIAERGARVEGRVMEAERGGRVLSVELTSLHTSDNQNVPIRTERFVKQSEPDHGQTAAAIAAGAVIGGIAGGLADGGKGAAIGIAAGGSAGAGTVLLTRKPAVLRVETRVTFRLTASVTLIEHAR